MVGGLLGGDCQGSAPEQLPCSPDPHGSPKQTRTPQTNSPPKTNSAIFDASDFIKEISVPVDFLDGDSAEVGLVPLENGIIIENLAEGQSVERIWAMMYMVRSILGLTGVGGQGISGSGDARY